jgi:hypothetical protein
MKSIAAGAWRGRQRPASGTDAPFGPVGRADLARWATPYCSRSLGGAGARREEKGKALCVFRHSTAISGRYEFHSEKTFDKRQSALSTTPIASSRGSPMLSRRAVLAGGVAALAAPPILARAQSSTGGAAAPTILRLERRDIEVNGKTASVYGISQPDGTFGLTTGSASPFAFGSKTGSASRA